MNYNLGGIGGGVSSTGKSCVITAATGVPLFSSLSKGNLPTNNTNQTRAELRNYSSLALILGLSRSRVEFPTC